MQGTIAFSKPAPTESDRPTSSDNDCGRMVAWSSHSDDGKPPSRNSHGREWTPTDESTAEHGVLTIGHLSYGASCSMDRDAMLMTDGDRHHWGYTFTGIGRRRGKSPPQLRHASVDDWAACSAFGWMSDGTTERPASPPSAPLRLAGPTHTLTRATRFRSGQRRPTAVPHRQPPAMSPQARARGSNCPSLRCGELSAGFGTDGAARNRSQVTISGIRGECAAGARVGITDLPQRHRLWRRGALVTFNGRRPHGYAPGGPHRRSDEHPCSTAPVHPGAGHSSVTSARG